MKHLDLFSGIGGFAYAADNVWGDVEHVFCDNDKFCQQVLKKHWPESEVYSDVKTITDTERKGWWARPISEKGQVARRDYWVDLLTGGFPCQPFSAAGVRRGTADDRYLWPAMLKVIRATNPRWVIAENVRGLLTWEQGLVVEQVCTDLEALGYEVQPLIIPAASLNAPHRRDRIWFIAHALNDGQGQAERQGDGTPDKVPQKHRSQHSTARQSKRTISHDEPDEYATNARHQRQTLGQQQATGNEQYSWESDWLTVATELCGVDDGLPVELDEFKLTKARNRAEQLKAYGNAIVPQVAIEIMQGIKHSAPKAQLTKDKEDK